MLEDVYILILVNCLHFEGIRHDVFFGELQQTYCNYESNKKCVCEKGLYELKTIVRLKGIHALQREIERGE